jgi:FkbM family methyltransferase
MVKKLIKRLYRLGLKKEFSQIDRLRYLKRLEKGGKSDQDDWYYDERDRAQYPGGEVLVRSRFRDIDLWFYCDRRIKGEESILRRGFHEPELLELMAGLVKPGRLVIDVGANIGGISIPLARAFPESPVHAYEPNPGAQARFRRNLSLNPAANLTLFSQALGRTKGQGRFHGFTGKDLGLSSFLTPRETGETAESIQVEIVCLDQVYLAGDFKVGLIKIDVQGFEIEVLEGAAKLVSRDRPAILFEHEDSLFPSLEEAVRVKKALADFFARRQYEVFYLTRHSSHLFFPVGWDRFLHGDLLALPVTGPS